MTRRPEDSRLEDDRLRSGKAVAAALMLAGILIAAAAIFLFVVSQRACGERRAGILPSPAASRDGASI